jgi:ferredoxin, 2Fe-2S
MARITYVEHNGKAHSVEVADGTSLMEGALGNGVPGIDGDCGGNAACATCHVYIDPAWLRMTGVMTEMEADMLDLADGREENSRLACQIHASSELDGLIVRMPETQH